MKLNVEKLAQFTANSVGKISNAQSIMSSEASSSNGKIKVTISGDYTMKDISIDPTLIASISADELGQQIKLAFNSAKEKIDVKFYDTLRELAGQEGMDISKLETP